MVYYASMLAALGSILAVAAQESSSAYSNPLLAKVFLYTYTDGFRHDSIPTAIKQLQAWGPYYNISFDATEDQTKVNSANLAQYDAVMCVHTTGDLFSTAGQAGFSDYLNKGGNFVAIHAAADGYPKPWAPYTDGLGSTFDHHPTLQNATFVKLASHPSTDPIPDQWNYGEEVYNFVTDPRKLGAKVIETVDASSYKDPDGTAPGEGTPHPITWYQDYNAGAVIKSGSPGPGVPGRSFYSSLGHSNETWENPIYMKHVMGGLFWTFFSNTTRVAQGLYGGAEPTIHTGSTNNVTSAVATAWTPVLGSNATAPAPPPPVATASASSSGAATPSATGTSGKSSGASFVGVPSALWSVAVASLCVLFGASSL